MNDSRSYKSPTREQAKSETRTAILHAVVKVILEQGIHAFTMQNVAQAAGISHRTVYRHFESREALLEGLQDLIQRQADDVGLSPPQDISRAIEVAGPLFEQFYRTKDMMHASVIAATAIGYQTRQQREGFDYFRRLLAVHFVHLSPAEIREAAAVFRYTISRYSWYVLAVNEQLPAAEAARAVTWSVRVLMEDLERRNTANSQLIRSQPAKAKPAIPKKPNTKQPSTKKRTTSKRSTAAKRKA